MRALTTFLLFLPFSGYCATLQKLDVPTIVWEAGPVDYGVIPKESESIDKTSTKFSKLDQSITRKLTTKSINKVTQKITQDVTSKLEAHIAPGNEKNDNDYLPTAAGDLTSTNKDESIRERITETELLSINETIASYSDTLQVIESDKIQIDANSGYFKFSLKLANLSNSTTYSVTNIRIRLVPWNVEPAARPGLSPPEFILETEPIAGGAGGPPPQKGPWTVALGPASIDGPTSRTVIVRDQSKFEIAKYLRSGVAFVAQVEGFQVLRGKLSDGAAKDATDIIDAAAIKGKALEQGAMVSISREDPLTGMQFFDDRFVKTTGNESLRVVLAAAGIQPVVKPLSIGATNTNIFVSFLGKDSTSPRLPTNPYAADMNLGRWVILSNSPMDPDSPVPRGSKFSITWISNLDLVTAKPLSYQLGPVSLEYLCEWAKPKTALLHEVALPARVPAPAGSRIVMLIGSTTTFQDGVSEDMKGMVDKWAAQISPDALVQYRVTHPYLSVRAGGVGIFESYPPWSMLVNPMPKLMSAVEEKDVTSYNMSFVLEDYKKEPLAPLDGSRAQFLGMAENDLATFGIDVPRGVKQPLRIGIKSDPHQIPHGRGITGIHGDAKSWVLGNFNGIDAFYLMNRNLARWAGTYMPPGEQNGVKYGPKREQPPWVAAGRKLVLELRVYPPLAMDGGKLKYAPEYWSPAVAAGKTSSALCEGAAGAATCKDNLDFKDAWPFLKNRAITYLTTSADGKWGNAEWEERDAYERCNYWGP